MIKGIGIDSVDQDRISKIFIKYGKRFQDRILGPREKRDFEKKINQIQKIRYLSNNFACKEAFSKVLGLGFSKGVAIKEIEILRNDNGKPYIHLTGNTQKISNKLNIQNINVSITDTKDLSTAFVTGE
jgi:holo-[acyl-carrier protein] synthase